MDKKPGTTLARHLGLGALTATGICSMVGASIHVVPFMIQKHVPGLGTDVLPAFLIAALPAFLSAMAYAALGTAMPRAGGSYLYVSRGLSPFAGFMASFSQWFGLSIVIGVVAYIIPDFLRDLAVAFGWTETAEIITGSVVRPLLALTILWIFVGVNLVGGTTYSRVLMPMMWAMFILGAIVIIAGMFYDHFDFLRGLWQQERRVFVFENEPQAGDRWLRLMSAGAVLFASFIGFDSIAQAGGEARDPRRTIPRATILALVSVTAFYLLFTTSAYHMIPASFIAEEAQVRDLTAPGLLGYVLPVGWTVAILAGATVALLNDLPGMILSVSRLLYAWACDGLFPTRFKRISDVRQTPHNAILGSACVASAGIIGSHLASDFFLGIDIMVTSMMVNFMLIAVTLLNLPRRNPEIQQRMTWLTGAAARKVTGWSAIVILAVFLMMHTRRDLQANGPWYIHSTWIWTLVMAAGATVYFVREKTGKINHDLFRKLPDQ